MWRMKLDNNSQARRRGFDFNGLVLLMRNPVVDPRLSFDGIL